MRARHVMHDANFSKKRIKSLIFYSPITLHSKDFLIELSFYHGLKILKLMKNIRLVLNKIDPGKFAKIINEAYIIAISPHGLNSRTPYIREDELQRRTRLAIRSSVGELMTLCLLTGITNRRTRSLT